MFFYGKNAGVANKKRGQILMSSIFLFDIVCEAHHFLAHYEGVF